MNKFLRILKERIGFFKEDVDILYNQGNFIIDFCNYKPIVDISEERNEERIKLIKIIERIKYIQTELDKIKNI